MTEVGIGQAKPFDVFQRKVDAAPTGVFTHIAQDIGQLQGDAELDGIVKGLVGPETGDVHGHQPNGGSHAITVVRQFFPRLVRAHRQVHRHAIQQFLSKTSRHMMALARVSPGHQNRVLLLVHWPKGRVPPARQLVVRVRPAAVHDVITDSTKAVQRMNRLALLRRQQQRAEIETLRVILRNLPADGIGLIQGHATVVERRLAQHACLIRQKRMGLGCHRCLRKLGRCRGLRRRCPASCLSSSRLLS